MPTLIETSTRISQSLGNPTSPSIGVISYWLRHNIGVLNTELNTSYTIDQSDGTVEPDLGEAESAILQTMYFVYYYDTKTRENLGAASVDPVFEISENGAVVRMLSKNTIALTYIQLKRQEQENLNKLVSFYRCNRATPQSIEGDDVTDTLYDGTNPVRSKAS